MKKIHEFNNRTIYLDKYDKKVSFNKEELSLILNLYAKMVAIGEWKDYCISMFKDLSIFSIYKNSTEFPIYMVKKKYLKSNKSNIFLTVAMDGNIIKRDFNLGNVLKPLEIKLIKRIK